MDRLLLEDPSHTSTAPAAVSLTPLKHKPPPMRRRRALCIAGHSHDSHAHFRPCALHCSLAGDDAADGAKPAKGKGKKGKGKSKRVRTLSTGIDSNRMCTGELAMNAGAKDIKVISFSLSYFGENLIEDTTLELNYGRRYGLVGRNGSGKSTFLEAIAAGDLSLPDHIDKYLLNAEASNRQLIYNISIYIILFSYS